MLVTIDELAEGIMRERVLRHVLQQLCALAIVGAFVVAVGQFQANRFWHYVFRDVWP